MRFKRFIRYAAAGSTALATALVLAVPASAQVTVDVNGNAIDFASAPIVQDGRVFVPLRGVFQRLGATVDYANGTIDANGNGRRISLQIGSTQATIDGQPDTVDVAPFIVGNTTFVPLRFVSQALGARVNWNNSNRVVSIDMEGAPSEVSYAAPASDDYADYAPPAIPVYDQPAVPGPDYIWQPGYWAWGTYGFYWVPGTWVAAPQPGYLWTPGYWAWNNGHYGWNPGYWAASVGFYGGVNYGAGYYGNGYSGGRWQNGKFNYNTYVTHVNTTLVKTVYIDRTVYVNNSTTRISYNGGPHGVQAHPTAQQQAVAHAPHLGMTPVQRQHVLAASQDRRLLAKVNHNAPPVLAVPQPLSASHPPAALVPVKPADRESAHAPAPPAVHVAPPEHAAPAPVVHAAPVVHPAPVMHAAPVAPMAHPAAPVVHAAPVAPVAHPAPPVVHAAPVAAPVAPRAPVVHTAPVEHAAPVMHAPPPAVVHAAPAPPKPAAVPPAHEPEAPKSPVPEAH